MTAQISPEQLKLRDQLARMAHRAGIKLVDPTRKLCEGQSCLRQTDDGKPLYKDDNHLRPFFVRENADFLDVTLFVK